MVYDSLQWADCGMLTLFNTCIYWVVECSSLSVEPEFLPLYQGSDHLISGFAVYASCPLKCLNVHKTEYFNCQINGSS